MAVKTVQMSSGFMIPAGISGVKAVKPVADNLLSNIYKVGVSIEYKKCIYIHRIEEDNL